MKILQLTHYYPEHKGGIEIAAYNLVKFLIREYEVKVEWIASDIDSPPKDVKGLTCTPVKTLNIVEKILGVSYPIWSLDFLFKVWRAVKNCDVVLLHDYIYMGNIVTFLYSCMLKKPVLLIQHTCYIPHKNTILRMLLSFINRTVGAFILKKATKVVFYSEVVQSYFSKSIDRSNFSVQIRNGLDKNLYFSIDKNEREQIRKALGLFDGTPMFIFVGRFIEKKGIHIVRKLASRFNSIKWIVAGWGPVDPGKWNLPNVTVYKKPDAKQLTPLYQAADLLVLPSKGEGFPLVVQESMACGTPVIVGKETTLAEKGLDHFIFSEEVDGKDTVDKWSCKINDILKDFVLLEELRPRVSDFATRRWCWKRTAKQYYKTIEEILAN